MRITLEIDDDQLASIMRETGLRKKSPAIRQALTWYVREREKKQFLKKVMEGGSDYSLTNEQVEALGVYDTDRHLGLD